MELRPSSVRPRVRYAAVGVVAAAILLASVVDPGGTGAGTTMGSTGPFGLVGADKWFHLAGYATLAAVLAAATRPVRWPQYVVVVLVVAAYGGAIEVVQFGLPARAFDLGDAATNTAGAIVGVLGWYVAVASGLVSRRR